MAAFTAAVVQLPSRHAPSKGPTVEVARMPFLRGCSRAGSVPLASGWLSSVSNWATALREYAYGSALGSDGGGISPA